MAILTVDELQVAMNVTFTDGQAGQAQYYIDRVSSFIENQTGAKFSLVTGQVIREQADSYGEVEMMVWPISAITNIHDYLTDTDLPANCYRWDGIQTIYWFRPYQVVDVTVDYGIDPVPADIKGIAIEAIRRGMASNPTSLKSKAVGDVVYQYGTMLDFPAEDKAVIQSYTSTEGTYQLPGPSNDPQYRWSNVLNGPDWPTDGWC